MCRCVRYRNLLDEEALAHWGLLRQKKNLYDFDGYLVELRKVFHKGSRMSVGECL